MWNVDIYVRKSAQGQEDIHKWRYTCECTADPTWGDMFESSSSKIERLFCHVSEKRDIRALSFELCESFTVRPHTCECITIRPQKRKCISTCECGVSLAVDLHTRKWITTCEWDYIQCSTCECGESLVNVSQEMWHLQNVSHLQNVMWHLQNVSQDTFCKCHIL